jgi:hypothetical protein
MEVQMSGGFEEIGVIGVDAGLCWVGDPCYVLHKSQAEKPKEIGKDWGDFCHRLKGDTTQFNYDLGHAGLGVAVSTGHGDGTYPVSVRKTKDGHIAEIRIVFIPEGED